MPGVSGGTVALVVGVYETVITSAGHVLSGLRRAVVDGLRGRGFGRSGAEFARVSWSVIVPLLIGMFAALVIMARFLETWVHDYPVHTRALFFGLVLASLWVPYSLAGRASRVPASTVPEGGVTVAPVRWTWSEWLLAAAAAVLAYAVVSLPPGEIEPVPGVVVAAGAIAVTALVLPGLSGSFLLLTMGLYENTLGAVNERDFGYLGLFALGAFVGLASLVKLLQWLLEHRRRVTLVILAGVMAGCLRALWPWQDDNRSLMAPDEHVGVAIGLAVLGAGLVAAVLVIAHRVGGSDQS